MLRECWTHVTLSETLPLRSAQRKLTRAFRLPQLWFRWLPPPPFISLCLFLSSSPMSLCNTTINHIPPTKDIWNPSTLWALRITLGELLSVHRHEHVTQGSGTHTNTHKQNTVDLVRPQMEPLKASFNPWQNSCSIILSFTRLLSHMQSCKRVSLLFGMFSYQHYHLLTQH